jgi:thiol-disulfide isomerase/thioredoxin
MIRTLIVFALVVALGCSTSKKEEQSSVDLSKVRLTDLKGQPVSLSDAEGKVVFLNFWATWCRPCLEEMPSIMRFREQLSGKDIVFYFASDEDSERIEGFLVNREFEGNFVRVENPEALGIQALPTTFIYDQSGKLVYSEIGYKNWDEPAAQELVTKYLTDEK